MPPKQNPVRSIDRLDLRTRADADEAHALMIRAYRIEAELLGSEDFPPLRRSVESVRRSENAFFGVRSAGRLVALAEIDDREATVDLSTLVVDPGSFRRGLGRLLVEHVLDEYIGRETTVSTGAANGPALGLYRRLGFVETGRSRRGSIEIVTLRRP